MPKLIHNTEHTETTTPATPAAGRRKLYPKATGWHDLDDAGTELQLASVTGTETLTNKTLTTPTIADFTNMAHDHLDADDGGTLSAAAIASGTLVHERGGLEADVSAYSGLVKITGGATSAVTAPTGTVVGTSDSQTLTNKTIDANSNTVTNIGASEVEVGIITGHSEDTSPSAANDFVLTYDASAAALKKAKITNLVSAASGAGLVTTLNIVIDGAGATITTGIKLDIVVDFACTINAVTMLADQSGSIVVDIWKDSYANFPPTDADSITAGAPPTISSATKSQDSTLTGWTTSISGGDILRFNVDSATSIQRLTLALKVTRS